MFLHFHNNITQYVEERWVDVFDKHDLPGQTQLRKYRIIEILERDIMSFLVFCIELFMWQHGEIRHHRDHIKTIQISDVFQKIDVMFNYMFRISSGITRAKIDN